MLTTVGELVFEKRRLMKLSQRQLGTLLQMDHTHLAKIESGYRLPLRFIPALSDFLSISETDLRRMVWNEKLLNQLEGPRIPTAKIEKLALRDRNIALRSLGRSKDFRFPSDRDQIPFKGWGLQVIHTEMLFSESVRQIFAGLFPKPFSFQTVTDAIVIVTNQVKKGRREAISDQTKLFQVLHELAHFRLHWFAGRVQNLTTTRADTPVYCSSGDGSLPELQANHYASSFLMPQEQIREYLDDKLSFSMRNSSQEACDRFHVEYWTLKRRLDDLKVKVRQHH